MNDIRIKNGDIVLSSRGGFEEIKGPSKIIQDLTNWLLNPEGYNRFHPWAGTGLDEFIGSRVDEVTNMDIKNEIERALSLYYSKQFEELRERIQNQSSPTIAMWMAEPDSVVESWKDVMVVNDGPTIRAQLGFRTVAGTETTFAINIVSTSDVTSLMVGTANASRIEEFPNLAI
jgi:hypothetical protein